MELSKKVFIYFCRRKTEKWIEKGRCPHLTCGKRVILVPWYAEQMGEGLSSMFQG